MIRGFLRMILNPFRRPPALQVAALCHRRRAGVTEVLMVKSLERGRWIIPKGWPMGGKTLAEAAATEAWEEAGVTGRLNPQSIGHYHYSKRQTGGLMLYCRAEVFEIAVESLADEFPESDKRKRFWVTPSQAAQKVHEPELKAILRAFSND